MKLPSHWNKDNPEDGFTLIELLTVVLIIGILSSVAVPAYLNQRKESVDAAVMSDVRNATNAVQEWANEAGAAAKPVPAEGIPGMSSSAGTILTVTGNSHSYCIEGKNAGGTNALRGYSFSSDNGVVGIGSCLDFRPSDTSGQDGAYSFIPAGSVMPADTDKMMVSIWNTAIAGCTTITLPVSGALNGTVDWGDGTTEPLAANISHTYSDTPGEKEVKINGTFANYSSSTTGTQQCITEVIKWGETGTTSIANAFAYASNLTKVVSIPSTATNASYMFRDATSFNGNVSTWNTSNLRDITGMFNGAKAFNRAVGTWNTSNIVVMAGVFGRAYAFNQSLNSWNTSKVSNFNGMFDGAISFNQPLDKWNVSNATRFSVMFRGAKNFNQPLASWNMSKATTTSWMFDSTAFNQDVSGWDVSNVTDMGWMFANAKNFNQDLSRWNVSKVTNMRMMFLGATSFNQDISGWDTSRVTTMDSMFWSAPAFDKNISGWNVSSVTTHTNFANYLRAEYRPPGW